MNKPFTYPEIRRIAELWRSNMLVADIARKTERSTKSIYDLAWKHRELFPHRPAQRPRRIDVRAARLMRQHGHTLQDIATRFGVSVVAVHLMFKRGTR